MVSTGAGLVEDKTADIAVLVDETVNDAVDNARNAAVKVFKKSGESVTSAWENVSDWWTGLKTEVKEIVEILM